MMFWVIFLHICVLCSGVWLFVRKYKNTNWLWIGLGAFIIKMLALCIFIWIHEKYYAHYQPDFKLIFEDAKRLAGIFYESPYHYWKILSNQILLSDDWNLESQPRAFFTVKLYSLLTIIAFQKFWLTAFYGSLLSLWGLWSLTNTLAHVFPKTKMAAVIAFLFVPSGVFWASATSKESILLFLISHILSLFINIIYLEKQLKYKILKCFFILILCVTLWKIKYYYAFGLSISMVLYLGMRYIQKSKLRNSQIAIALGLIVFSAIILTFLHPNIRLDTLPEALYNNYILTIKASPQKSFPEFDLQPTWLSVFQKSPYALYLGLFSPMPWDSKNWQMILVSIENILLMSLLVLCIFKLIQKKYIQTLDFNFLIMLFVYISIMAVFLALSSPNFGALSRYRCGFSPFLWYIILSYIPIKKPSFYQK